MGRTKETAPTTGAVGNKDRKCFYFWVIVLSVGSACISAAITTILVTIPQS